jgi:hypothetical protein
MEIMAGYIVNSKLFGLKTIEEAMALMLLAQSKGRHPMTVASEYDIIQGKPAMKARAMLAYHQRSGGTWEWVKMGPEEVSAKFASPSHPLPLIVSWTIERAKKAGLATKEMWGKYAQDMLSARVIREGVSKTNPAACDGFYTPEEVIDFTDKAPGVQTEETHTNKWAAPQSKRTEFSPETGDAEAAPPQPTDAPRSITPSQVKAIMVVASNISKIDDAWKDRDFRVQQMNIVCGEKGYKSTNELSSNEASNVIKVFTAILEKMVADSAAKSEAEDA